MFAGFAGAYGRVVFTDLVAFISFRRGMEDKFKMDELIEQMKLMNERMGKMDERMEKADERMEKMTQHLGQRMYHQCRCGEEWLEG